MQPYRIYFLDSDGHIVKAELRECVNDANAVEWLETVSKTRPRVCSAAEIWCRGRMVRRQALERRTMMPGKGEEFRRKAQSARHRSTFEPEGVRRKGLIAIADQYDRLADELKDGSGPARD